MTVLAALDLQELLGVLQSAGNFIIGGGGGGADHWYLFSPLLFVSEVHHK